MSITNDYTITITTTQIVGGATVYVPRTNLSPVLKAQPWETIVHSGTHLGNGSYLFQNVDDGLYKLYESSDGDEIQSWGGSDGKWIGDNLLEKYSLSGDVVYKTGGSLSGELNMTSHRIFGLPVQTGAEAATDAATVGLITGTNSYVSEHYLKKNDTSITDVTTPINFKSETTVQMPQYGEDITNKNYVDNEITGTNSYVSEHYLKKDDTTVTTTVSTPIIFTGGLTANSLPTLNGELNMTSHRITNLPVQTGTEAATDAATVGLITGTNSYVSEHYLKKNDTNTTTVSTPIEFIGQVNTMTPISGMNITNKNYVDNEITSRINVFGLAQESVNVVKVMPNGTVETGKVYTTIADAVTYCYSQNPSISNQFTIELKGMGSNSPKLSWGKSSSASAYICDYVHLKAIDSGIMIETNYLGIASGEMKASYAGATIVENCYISIVGTGYHSYIFENILFRNCKFSIQQQKTATFSGCKFEGINEFKSYVANQITFNGCNGNKIFGDKQQTFTGTNNVLYYTLNSDQIGAANITYSNNTISVDTGMSIKDGLSAQSFYINAITSNSPGIQDVNQLPNKYYGVNDSRVLFEPDAWVDIWVNGTKYIVPLYSPKE